MVIEFGNGKEVDIKISTTSVAAGYLQALAKQEGATAEESALKLIKNGILEKITEGVISEKPRGR